ATGAAAAATPAAAAGAAAAAAETPKRSSRAWTRFERSSTDIVSICFTKSSVEIAISASKSFSVLSRSITCGHECPRFSLRVCFACFAAFLFRDLIDDDRDVADVRLQHRRESANRRLHEEQQLRDQLITRG